MTQKKILVYGTLLSNLGNWSWALNREGATFLGDYKVEGNYSMVSLGGFPGVIPHDEGETTIISEVYEVTDAIYKSVERLEGYPTFYNKRVVKTPWGDADMYILDDSYLNQEKIESGDWKEFINIKKQK